MQIDCFSASGKNKVTLQLLPRQLFKEKSANKSEIIILSGCMNDEME